MSTGMNNLSVDPTVSISEDPEHPDRILRLNNVSNIVALRVTCSCSSHQHTVQISEDQEHPDRIIPFNNVSSFMRFKIVAGLATAVAFWFTALLKSELILKNLPQDQIRLFRVAVVFLTVGILAGCFHILSFYSGFLKKIYTRLGYFSLYTIYIGLTEWLVAMFRLSFEKTILIWVALVVAPLVVYIYRRLQKKENQKEQDD